MMISLCPFCRKNGSAPKPLWPFCSERCKNHDLGNWAKEEYRIEGSSLDEHESDDGLLPEEEVSEIDFDDDV